jgi:hypothetical protein
MKSLTPCRYTAIIPRLEAIAAVIFIVQSAVASLWCGSEIIIMEFAIITEIIIAKISILSVDL